MELHMNPSQRPAFSAWHHSVGRTLVPKIRHQLPWAAGDANAENVDHPRFTAGSALCAWNGKRLRWKTGVTSSDLPVAIWMKPTWRSMAAGVFQAGRRQPGPHCRFYLSPCRNSKAAYRFLQNPQQREEVADPAIHQHGESARQWSRIVLNAKVGVRRRWTPTD